MRYATAAVVMLALGQLAGAAQGADGFEYKEPAGWTRGKLAGGSVAFQPPGVPAGKGCSVMFLQPADGELAAHFEQTWKRTPGAVRVEPGGRMVSGKTSGGMETRSVTAVVEAGGQKTWMHFFAFQVGPRVQPCDGVTLEGTYSWKWGGGESVVRFTRDAASPSAASLKPSPTTTSSTPIGRGCPSAGPAPTPSARTRSR